MFEAEVKLRVTPLEMRKLPARAKAAGFLYAAASEQIDSYFSSPSKDFQAAGEALRLRESRTGSEETFYLTYKGPRLSSSSVSREEREVTVSNARETVLLLAALGFSQAYSLKKSRRYFARGPVTLGLDEIEGVGSFIELEIMTNDAEKIPGIVDELYRIAESLGIPKDRAETKSYLELFLETRQAPG